MKIDKLIYINWMFLFGQKLKTIGEQQIPLRCDCLGFYCTTMTTMTLDDWLSEIPLVLSNWMKEGR